MTSLRVAALAACLAALVNAPAHAASTTYTYTGNDFTSLLGAYTGTDKVTGSFTLAAALPANLTIYTLYTPTSFSFSDGMMTVASGGTNTGTFAFKTDASGAIIDWQIAVINPGSVSSPYDNISTVNAPGILGVFDLAHNAADTSSGESFTAGTWTVSAVPEPSGYALMLSGLGVVAVAARRRGVARSAESRRGGQ